MSAPCDRDNAEQLPTTDEIRQAAQRLVKAIRRVFPDSSAKVVEWKFRPSPSDCQSLERWERAGRPEFIPPVSLWGYFGRSFVQKHHATSAFGITSQVRGVRQLGRELLRCWRLAKRIDPTNPQHAVFAQLVDRFRTSPWAASPPRAVTVLVSNMNEWHVSEVFSPGVPQTWPYRILVCPPPAELVAQLDRWGTKLRLHVTPTLSPDEVSPRHAVVESDTAPAITIPADKDPAYVLALGHTVQLPSIELLELLRGMIAKFPGGLKIDEVRNIHSSGGTRLAKMAEEDPWFGAAVCRPGRRGKGGYRIRSNAEAQAAFAQTMLTQPSLMKRFKAQA